MGGPNNTPGLSWDVANAGVYLPGNGGGPLIGVVFATVNGIQPEDCEFCTIQLFPSDRFSIGATNGSIVVTCTFTNAGDDKIYSVTGGGSPAVMPDGFWGQKFRAAVSVADHSNVSIVFTVEWEEHNILSYPETMSEQTTTPELVSSSNNTDIDKKENEVTFSYNNAAAENPVAFAVVQNKGGVKTIATSIPFTSGTVDYTVIDATIDIGDDVPVTYTIIPYRLGPPARTAESEPSGEFDFIITMGLEFAEDFSSIMLLLADPSGIYTLVPGKTHDTLYERTGVNHVDMAIPEPFGRSSYVP